MGHDLAKRLAGLHTALLCDVLDGLGFRDSFLGGNIEPLAPGMMVAGTAFTMRCEPVDAVSDQPYATLLAAFAALAPGDVVVLQTADRRSGMWGELLTVAARVRGATGAVMDGAARDTDQIAALGFPTFAAGTSPLDAAGRQEVVAFGEPITCGEARIAPGDMIFGDAMGAIVIPADLASSAVTLAEAKSSGETTARADLERGDPITDVFDRYGIL